ncbi:hypothetical protein MTO96_046533, partial [Rhipicephalus appendiculatus]
MKVLLENGKHILCEKPLTMNRRDTEDICRMAKQKKLFLMEALKSRYLPTYKHMEELLQNGTIGEVRYVHSTLGNPMENETRMFIKELGGSVLLTLGTYCVNIVLQVFSGERPVKISACGDLSPQGTDKGVAVSMEFSGGRLATFALSGVVKLPGVAEIFGRKGKITIHPPFHAPTCVESPAGKFEIQFPPPSVPLNFPNSSGLRYEAEE